MAYSRWEITAKKLATMSQRNSVTTSKYTSCSQWCARYHPQKPGCWQDSQPYKTQFHHNFIEANCLVLQRSEDIMTLHSPIRRTYA